MPTTERSQEPVVEQLRSLEIDRGEQVPHKNRRWLIVVICFIVIAGLLFTLSNRSAESSFGVKPVLPGEKAATSASVEKTVVPPATSDWLVAGYLVARKQSLVSAEVTATVASLQVSSGDRIESGHVIAELDGALARADLRVAESRVEAAKRSKEAVEADRIEAERFLNRATALRTDGAISEADFDRAKARFDALTAQFRAAEAQQQIAIEEAGRAETFLAKHTIIAPFSGVVVSCHVEVGETVSPMSSNGSSGVGVCTIVDPASIEIEIDVPETLLSRVMIGVKAEAFLDAYPDDGLAATVIAIAPEANREKSTILVRLKFEEPDERSRPNMSVKVNLKRSDME